LRIDIHIRLHRDIAELGDTPWPKRLTFLTGCPRLDEEGLELIEQWIASVPRPRLIQIDTLQKVRKPRGNGQSLYEADYQAVAPLQELAGKRGIAIILVHHVRKEDAADPLDMVSGSTCLTGAADTILVLNRDSIGVTLYGRGRDIDEIEKAVSFDQVTGRWAIEGDADEFR
jgi:hypothetical protein